MDPDPYLRPYGLPLFLTSANNDSTLWISLFVVLLLVFINGFFSAAEMAIITLNDNKVQKLAEEGDRTYKKIYKMIKNPGRFLATVQVGVTFAGFLSSAFAGTQFGDRLYNLIDPARKSTGLYSLSIILVTVVLSYVSLILGELVPKQIGLHKAESVAKAGIGFIRFFDLLMRPFTLFLNFSTNLVLKLFRIDPTSSGKNVTEEELRMMIDVSSLSGAIESEESIMLQNVFEFNDKEVCEIMVHRKNIIGIETDASYDTAVELAKSEGYTRIPVFEETMDSIVGILNVKDLLYFISKFPKDVFDIRKIMREPLFVPETKKIDDMFRELKEKHEALAIVIDEYGGVSGLLTMEDLLEEIVGNIQDEYDDEELPFIKCDDGSYIVEGMTALSELVKKLPEFEFKDEDADYETIAGLVLHKLDRIPEPDEHPEVDYMNYHFKVLEMDDKRIAKLRMEILPISKSEPEQQDSARQDNSD